MLLPYKVENPVKTFPKITLAIISANVLAYMVTTDYFLVVSEGALQRWAYISGQPSIVAMFTHLFLHADVFHLAGNMFFLWLFSRAVEDRLGVASFLLVYFVAGVAGVLAQDVFTKAFAGSGVPILGASGAVMGVMGAYLFMFPWSRVYIFYWFYWIIRGTFATKAIWVIGSYFLLDLFGGAISGLAGTAGGVANFAHLFGLLAGFAFCKAIGARRDTAALSDAKATVSDATDFSEMPFWNLLHVLEEEPGNLEALTTLMDRAGGEVKRDTLARAMKSAGPGLIEKAPALVADYLISQQGDMKLYQPNHILKLASMIKTEGKHEDALRLYQILIHSVPDSPDTEMAFFRMAQIQWIQLRDAVAAESSLTEMQNRFPHGSLSSYGYSLRGEIQRLSQNNVRS